MNERIGGDLLLLDLLMHWTQQNSIQPSLSLSLHTLQEVLTLQGIFNTLAHVTSEQTLDVFLLTRVCACVCKWTHFSWTLEAHLNESHLHYSSKVFFCYVFKSLLCSPTFLWFNNTVILKYFDIFLNYIQFKRTVSYLNITMQFIPVIQSWIFSSHYSTR